MVRKCRLLTPTEISKHISQCSLLIWFGAGSYLAVSYFAAPVLCRAVGIASHFLKSWYQIYICVCIERFSGGFTIRFLGTRSVGECLGLNDEESNTNNPNRKIIIEQTK